MQRWQHLPWKIICIETATTVITALLVYGYVIGKFIWCHNLWWVVASSILFAYIVTPIVQIYIAVAVLLVTRVRILPARSFGAGIPNEHRAALVYCVRAVTESSVDLAIENLQKSVTDNADQNLLAIYLSDTSVPHLVMKEIRAIKFLQGLLGRDKVFLFHRDSHWGKKWGGYQDLMSWLHYGENFARFYTDKKYGRYQRHPSQKLFEFSDLNNSFPAHLLTATEASTGIIGDISQIEGSAPPRMPYLLISDADVVWPKGTASRTVEKMAHANNRGFHIFQPSIGIGNRSTTLFAKTLCWGRQFGEFVGLAIWKIYDASLFFGKAGIKVENYLDTMLREGSEVLHPSLLSHDFIEACYLRTAYMPDIRILEDVPLDYMDDIIRLERWFLGDMLGLYYELIRPRLTSISNRLKLPRNATKTKPLPFVRHSLMHLVACFDFVPLAFSVYLLLAMCASYIPGTYLPANPAAEIGVLSVVLGGILLIPRTLGPILFFIHLRGRVPFDRRLLQAAPLELFLSTLLFLQHLIDRNVIFLKTIWRLWWFIRQPSKHPLEWIPSSASERSAMRFISCAQLYWQRKGVLLSGVTLVFVLILTHRYRVLWYTIPFWASFMLGPGLTWFTGRASGGRQE